MPQFICVWYIDIAYVSARYCILKVTLAKISAMLPIVINVPTRQLTIGWLAIFLKITKAMFVFKTDIFPPPVSLPPTPTLSLLLSPYLHAPLYTEKSVILLIGFFSSLVYLQLSLQNPQYFYELKK